MNAGNIKQVKARISKMEKRTGIKRLELFGDIPDEHLWDRKKANGFTTMPRTMAYVMNIIDTLTKGQPGGHVYLTIWCRLFFAGIVDLPSEKQMAFEAGFTGERAVDSWRKRMRSLKKLGFIDYKAGVDHEFQWVIILNPHHVIQRLGTKVQEKYRSAWKDRAREIGATDIEQLPEQISESKASKPLIAKKSLVKKPNN